MDSRDGPPPPRPNIMMGHTNAYPTNHHHHHHHHNPSMIVPNSAPIMHSNSGFPFNTPPPRPQEPMNRPVYDGSSQSQNLRPGGGGGSASASGAENIRKKRGRPRKYVPDGSIALGLAPAPAPAAQVSAPSAANHGNSGNSDGTPSSETASKRNRGRPPGSGKRQLDALGGTGGVGFTPHVITIEVGEDIIEKINAFSMQGPRAVCILSANGAICNVTLRQPTIPATVHGPTLTYEGRYEIISLSGSFLHSNTGDQKRGGNLSVSLAGPDGRVIGGVVCGVLLAASPIQVIVGSFIEDGKKTNCAAPSAPQQQPQPQPQMLSFSGATAAASPPSQGGSSGDSSDENGGSPINQGSGLYNNANQAIHSFHMYQQLWTGQTQQ